MYQLPTRRSPWAYFWPMTLAVALGVLIADGLKLLLAVAGLAAVVGAWNGKPVQGATSGHLPARPGAVPPALKPWAHVVTERWYEPEVARYRGQSRSCIPGRGVHEWRDGRWQLVWVGDRTIPCKVLQ